MKKGLAFCKDNVIFAVTKINSREKHGDIKKLKLGIVAEAFRAYRSPLELGIRKS